MGSDSHVAPAAYLGVPSLWVMGVAVPSAVAGAATGTFFWGLVALAATMAVVVLASAARGRVRMGERSWFGVPAVVVWILMAVGVSGGQPSDADLFSLEAAGLAAVVLALDALVRGKIG